MVLASKTRPPPLARAFLLEGKSWIHALKVAICVVISHIWNLTLFGLLWAPLRVLALKTHPPLAGGISHQREKLDMISKLLFGRLYHKYIKPYPFWPFLAFFWAPFWVLASKTWPPPPPQLSYQRGKTGNALKVSFWAVISNIAMYLLDFFCAPFGV